MSAPNVFIIYQNAELELAESFKHLFETWGYNAFYCRQARRDGNSYRTELRNNLINADAVVLLLSREFQWSSYCQAEAGATMALNKPFIPIVIPPATKSDVVNEIAVVLEGSQFLTTSDQYFINQLKDALITKTSKSKPRAAQLLKKLQKQSLRSVSPARTNDHSVEVKNRNEVEAALAHIADAYKLGRPKKFLTPTWSRLGDEDCKTSIVANISKSLTDCHSTSAPSETSLAFVGVSLKYSLKLITRSLEQLPDRDVQLPKANLKIRLVHMDDQAHILHALKDTRDIDLIRDNFGPKENEDAKIQSRWRELCGEKGINPPLVTIHRIDYIPPRVGILINDDMLYAGRCAFKPVGLFNSSVYNLDVGELEYQFYHRHAHPNPDLAANAIDEFNGFLLAYEDRKNNNGVAAVQNASVWIERIGQCLRGYDGEQRYLKDIKDVTFISASCTKFQSILLPLLDAMKVHKYKDCPKITLYVHDGDPQGKWKSSLETTIKENFGDLPPLSHFSIIGYSHAPTFRAVIVGDLAIGIQSYITIDGQVAPKAKKVKTGLIFTHCYEHLSKLKDDLLAFATGGTATATPIAPNSAALATAPTTPNQS